MQLACEIVQLSAGFCMEAAETIARSTLVVKPGQRDLLKSHTFQSMHAVEAS
jgi:hypothetical protein